jgi:hypothetical protein
MPARRRRAARRRVALMLRARIARDRNLAHSAETAVTGRREMRG